MRRNMNLWVITAVVIACILIVWSFTSIQGSQRTYEVQPQITLPGYSTDSSRILDAYERLMERYMDLVEQNLAIIDTDIKSSAERLNSIDTRLKELCERTANIEKALGIKQPEGPVKRIDNLEVSRSEYIQQ